VRVFLDENKVAYPVGIGSQAQFKYGVADLPYYIIIGSDGVIRFDGPDLPPLADVAALAKPAPVPAAPADPQPGTTPADDTQADQAIAQATKDLRQAVGRIEQSISLLNGLKAVAEANPDNPKIAGKIIKLTTVFLGGGNDMGVRKLAVEITSLFKNDPAATDALAVTLDSLARKDTTFLVLQCAVVNALPVTGRYNAKAAAALCRVIDKPYGADEQLIRAALKALGEIRSVASVDGLVKAISKLAATPEDLNFYHLDNDRTKLGIWFAVENELWWSLAQLTGVQVVTNGRLRQDLDGYSKWKRWVETNKTMLEAKFKLAETNGE
jgi:hypothetical protein